MNAPYKNERNRQNRISIVTGIVLTVAIHLSFAAFGAFKGLKYLYPPPEETAMLIDFTEDAEKPAIPKIKAGAQPTSAAPEPEKEINLVQRSEAQHEGTQANEAPEATTGTDGDVEVPEPPRQKEINRRALFHAADNKTDKDTLAAQTASKVTDALKAGHAQGNTKTGKTVGKPNAKLPGRSVVNGIPEPAYSVQKDGTVVVDIWVDNYGKVVRAVAGVEGTTVTDSKLWNEARKAALETHFNMSADAPAMQKGTITYIFSLKSE